LACAKLASRSDLHSCEPLALAVKASCGGTGIRNGVVTGFADLRSPYICRQSMARSRSCSNANRTQTGGAFSLEERQISITYHHSALDSCFAPAFWSKPGPRSCHLLLVFTSSLDLFVKTLSGIQNSHSSRKSHRPPLRIASRHLSSTACLSLLSASSLFFAFSCVLGKSGSQKPGGVL
jgi:hypothetical protein